MAITKEIKEHLGVITSTIRGRKEAEKQKWKISRATSTKMAKRSNRMEM